jgi:D-alanyl-D-alanine carboxypeptidase (penicillin-binding protein 5/6)
MLPASARIYISRQVLEMKGKGVFCFVVLAAIALWPIKASADAVPSVSAKAAIVVSVDDGCVVYAKNEHDRLPIASTTKIMTSLLTLEAAAVNNRVITVTPEMVRVEGSSMGLRAGDKLTLYDLAVGMLMVSGNDAANTAALSIGGTIENFAAMMNAKAASLGMKDTHYVTPSGLDDNEHYSSAYDLALLTRAALQNTQFANIVRQKSIQIHFLSPNVTHSYGNHNKLLSFYQYCTGVKTGFTKKSGRCLVSSAEKDGVRLIAVTLNDPNDWEDHKKLLDYGFSCLVSRPVNDSSTSISLPIVGGVQGTVQVTGTAGENVVIGANDQLKRTVELPQFVYAPVKKGQVLGRVRYTCGGKSVTQTELVAAEDVPQAPKQKMWFQILWKAILDLFSGG